MGLHTAYDDLSSVECLDFIKGMLDGIQLDHLTYLIWMIESHIKERRERVFEMRKRNRERALRRQQKKKKKKRVKLSTEEDETVSDDSDIEDDSQVSDTEEE